MQTIFFIFLSVCFASANITSPEIVAMNLMKDLSETGKVIFRRTARSKLILSYMDKTIDPCDDFYQYSCGNWKNPNKAPSMFDDNDVLQHIVKRLEHHIEGLMTRLSGENYVVTNVVESKMKSYYQSCLNHNFLQGEKSETITNLLDSIFGPYVLTPEWISDDFDWIGIVARMQIYGANAFISESVSTASEKPTIYVKRGSVKFNAINFLDLLQPNKPCGSILKESTIGRKYAELDNQTAEDIVNFARNLTNFWISSNSNASKKPRILTLDELIREIPQIDWSRYFTILLGSSMNRSMSVIVGDKHYFHQLNSLMLKTSPQTISNYLAIHFLEHLLEDRLISKDLLQKFCTSRVLEGMALAVNAFYMRKFNITNIRAEVLNIIVNLTNSFKTIIKQSDWMSDHLKAEIVNKINRTSFEIAYPDYIMSDDKLDKIYQGLTINSNRFHQNFLQFLAFKMKFVHDKLREINNDINLNLNIMDIKIRYNQIADKITIPVGILVPPLYHQHLPMAYKYGSIGWMVGNAFTNEIINNREFTTTNDDLKIRNERKECFVLQYNNFSVLDLGEISGENTVDENIGDNVGVKVSFDSYVDWLKRNDASSEIMPELNMTSRQLFFLSFAQSQCGDYNTASYMMTMNFEEHVISKYRVIGSLANLEEFSDEFKCSVDSAMNSKRKCSFF